MSSEHRYRVAAIQFEPVLGAKAEHIRRLLELAETSACHDARLIVMAEIATTGYCWGSANERILLAKLTIPCTLAGEWIAG